MASSSGKKRVLRSGATPKWLSAFPFADGKLASKATGHFLVPGHFNKLEAKSQL